VREILDDIDLFAASRQVVEYIIAGNGKRGKCLSITHPEIAKEWDFTKNKLTPKEVTYGTSKKVYWICPKGHEFDALINNRARRGDGCPCCSGHKVHKDNCLATLRPDLAKEWHPTLNDLTPEEVTCGNNKKVWWICPKGHEYEIKISHRCSRNQGCHYCSGRKVCQDNCLATLSPDLAKEWHPTLNDLTPEEVTCGSKKKVYWICPKGHEYDATINNRTNGANCSYCSGQRVHKDNCLATLKPDLAKEWDFIKNDLTPEEVTCGSPKKVYWICPKGHEYDSTISSRTNGTNCPYCSGQRVCQDNCLATLRPDLAKEWHPTLNDLTPEEVTCGSPKKVWWICPKGHEYDASIWKRARRRQGCRICSYGKSEKEVGDILKIYFDKWKILRQKKIWDSYKRYNHKRYCDYWLERNGAKIMVEYDGRQHFEPVRFANFSWKKAQKNLEKTQIKDKLDAKFCKEHGIILHRIKYNEDKEESIKRLKASLELFPVCDTR
jgi:hypothetical protein